MLILLGLSFFGYTLIYNFSKRSNLGLFLYGSSFLVFSVFMRSMKLNFNNCRGLKIDLSKCGNFIYYDTFK